MQGVGFGKSRELPLSFTGVKDSAHGHLGSQYRSRQAKTGHCCLVRLGILGLVLIAVAGYSVAVQRLIKEDRPGASPQSAFQSVVVVVPCCGGEA